VSKKKLNDLRIKISSCRTTMAYAPESEVEGLNLKVGQWVTVVGECDKFHVAYVNNYDENLKLWFFMVEKEPIQ
jgi:hypothetical protein